MQPTKEQWKEIEQQLRSQFGSVKLRVDGYDISLSVQTDRMKLVIVIYVNGWIKGEWLSKECEERRRFMPERKVFLHSAKHRALFAKLDRLTKRQLTKQKAEGTGLYEKATYYVFHFQSFRALKSKLINNNESIEVVQIGHGS